MRFPQAGFPARAGRPAAQLFCEDTDRCEPRRLLCLALAWTTALSAAEPLNVVFIIADNFA